MSTRPIPVAVDPDPEIEHLQALRARGQERRRAVLERFGVRLPELRLDEHLDALAADLAGEGRKEPR